MKRIVYLAVLVAVIVLSSCGTAPEPLPPEERIVQEIFEVDKPKDDLYRLSMEWIAKAFKSAKAVIQYEDKEEGIIVGKGMMVVVYNTSLGTKKAGDTFFTLTIEVKDGKVRATVEDAYYDMEVMGETVRLTVEYQSTMDDFRVEVMNLFASLESALKEEAEEW